MRILLAEDGPMIGDSLRKGLRGEGFTIDWIQDGRGAERALEATEYALVLLDLGLPNKNGLVVLRGWRQRGLTVPVLILTARDAVPDRVKGLNSGADDYLIKPFDLAELLARMRALLRRQAGRAREMIEIGALRLDPAAHAVCAVRTGIRPVARPAGSAGGGAVPRTTGGSPVRLGRGGGKQRHRSSHPQPAPQAEFRRHPYRAGRRLPAWGKAVTSIRQRLLVGLLVGLTLVLGVAGYTTYRQAHAAVNALFDDQLRQTALALRNQNLLALATSVQVGEGEGDLLVQIWDRGGLLYVSRKAWELPFATQPGFADLL